MTDFSKAKPMPMTSGNLIATREGRKTMTRRLLNNFTTGGWEVIQENAPGEFIAWMEPNAPDIEFTKKAYPPGTGIKYPYQPGLYYIPETHYLFGNWQKCGTTKTGKQKWEFVNFDEHKPDLEVLYLDSAPREYRISMDKENPQGKNWYKRNARFMPKKYARTFVEVTGVKVERLNEISEADAVAEGVELLDNGNKAPNPEFQGFTTARVEGYKSYLKQHTWIGADREMIGRYVHAGTCNGPIFSFKSLWQSIHGFESWGNSWVFAVSYKLIK